jgi:hypothetical protein
MLAEGNALLSALAAVKARADVAPQEETAEMPVWVKKLAPPEVYAEGELVEEVDSSSVTGRTVALDKGLVSMLSAAMDSEDELELTPELLAPYSVSSPEPVVHREVEPSKDMKMDTAVPSQPTSYSPTNRQDTDWLVILLIISFLVLTIAAIVTIVLLILL